MNDLDQMKSMWQAQVVPSQQEWKVSPKSLSRFQEQMKHFERENAPQYFLFMALISGLMSGLMLWQAWKNPADNMFWLGLIFLLGSLMAGGQYWTGRQAPYPDEDLEAYLRHTRRRLSWRRKILGGGMLGMGTICLGMMADQGIELGDMDIKSKVGLSAVVVIFAFVMGAALWWQKHYGPYRISEMEQLLNELMSDLAEEK